MSKAVAAGAAGVPVFGTTSEALKPFTSTGQFAIAVLSVKARERVTLVVPLLKITFAEELPSARLVATAELRLTVTVADPFPVRLPLEEETVSHEEVLITLQLMAVGPPFVSVNWVLAGSA